MWLWSRKTAVPDDVDEAIAHREEAQSELEELRTQGNRVNQLTSKLAERRALNHFGDSIQISFTRRGHA